MDLSHAEIIAVMVGMFSLTGIALGIVASRSARDSKDLRDEAQHATERIFEGFRFQTDRSNANLENFQHEYRNGHKDLVEKVGELNVAVARVEGKADVASTAAHSAAAAAAAAAGAAATAASAADAAATAAAAAAAVAARKTDGR